MSGSRDNGKPLVLLVDDEQSNRKLVTLLLGRVGYVVRTAPSGEEGLIVAKAEHPDLILLDVMMPVMDGHEMLLRLKRDPDTRDIPVIMLTARGGEQDIAVSFQRGAVFHVDKPYETRDLLQKIAVALNLTDPDAPSDLPDEPPPDGSA